MFYIQLSILSKYEIFGEEEIVEEYIKWDKNKKLEK